jgi:ABC-type bacteriocin/lantibiotic exporter with double-glycine peptidase domain
LDVIGNIAWFGVAALPVSMGVAILKYRLYEIDRIISRTLAYAIVTGLLVGVYAGLVLLATEVLQLHGPVTVAASTLVAAALFNPLRRRVQDAVDPDAVHADLTDVVHAALEPTHVSVWLGN